MYEIPDLGFSNLLLAYSKVANGTPLQILSLSYGANEALAQTGGGNYASMTNSSLMPIFMQNVAIFASSGDGGSNPGPPPGHYIHNNPMTGPLAPQTPASSQYVVAVGGTRLQAPGGGIDQAWTLDAPSNAPTDYQASGGGISSVSPIPNWQQSRVPSASWRCVPDVSSAGDLAGAGYLYLNSQANYVWGTSWSAPTWAGMCALMNSARQAFSSSLSPLGNTFNSLVYPLETTSCFHDITQGYGTDPYTGAKDNGAYTPGSGYDLVTGIGTPDLNVLHHTLTAPFFTGEASLGGNSYYLALPNASIFGYYYDVGWPTFEHLDMGYEVIIGTDSSKGIFIYDFLSGDTMYTSPTYYVPYLYDYTLNATLYYYPAAGQPGRYTSNPRYFYNFATGKIITR